MNVVIIGGGQKFGKTVANKFQDEGNNVYILSHKDYDERPNHLSANFLDHNSVVSSLKQLIQNIDHIDILLYCTNFDYGPCSQDDFSSNSNIDGIVENWKKTILIQAIIPHIISTIVLGKMNSASKIVFMTSHIAFEIPRNYCVNSVGHPGGKASQNHLMFALANSNDKQAIVYSISTHLDFDNAESYNLRVDKIFDNLKLFDAGLSGKIIEIYK